MCVLQQQQQNVRLPEHRKSQLWRGIVSISLIEGRNFTPMDTNGLSDPYVKFRLGHQKYKSKVLLLMLLLLPWLQFLLLSPWLLPHSSSKKLLLL